MKAPEPCCVAPARGVSGRCALNFAGQAGASRLGAALADRGTRCRLPDTCPAGAAAALDRMADRLAAAAADLPAGSLSQAARL